jgi:hypothetical protein
MLGRLETRGLQLVTANWPMKLTALALAAVLWAAVASDQPTSQRLPITLQVQGPADRPLTQGIPEIHGIFSGPSRELLKLYASAPVLRLTIPDSVPDSLYTVQLNPGAVEITKQIDARVESLDPASVTFTLETVGRRTVPVVARVTGRPDSGFAMFGGISVSPGSVLVVGPRPRLDGIRQVSTVPVDLAGFSGAIRRAVRLDTAGLGPVRVMRQEVEISTEVGPLSERVLMGVPVVVRGERGRGWASEPPAVIVTVRGPRARLQRLTRDSVEVSALSDGTGRRGPVRLRVVAPLGMEGSATPDTAIVQRRSRG